MNSNCSYGNATSHVTIFSFQNCQHLIPKEIPTNISTMSHRTSNGKGDSLGELPTGFFDDIQDIVYLNDQEPYNEEIENIEKRRRELGYIQKDLQRLMERLNSFVANTNQSNQYNQEQEEGVTPMEDFTKNNVCLECTPYEECKYEELNEEGVQNLAGEIQRHISDMREINNLSVLTHILMKRIRRVTDMNKPDEANAVNSLQEPGCSKDNTPFQVNEDSD